MNKNNLGAVMAIFIFAIPAVFILVGMSAVAGGGGTTIVSIASWVFWSILAVVAIYLVAMLVNKHSAKAGDAIKWSKGLFTKTEKTDTGGKKKDDDLAAQEKFSSRSLWGCIVVGATGFHFFHVIWPLFVCLIGRSFFLPTTTFSTFVRWAYVLAIIIFFFLPGVQTYSSAKWEELKSTTEQAGVEAKNPVREIAPVEAKVEVFTLGKEWVSFVPLIPGKDMVFECTDVGAKMKVTFSSAKNNSVYSGQEIDCPTVKGPKVHVGDSLADSINYFRDPTGRKISLHIYNAKKL